LFSIIFDGQAAKSQINPGNKMRMLNYDLLEPMLHKSNDNIYLVNFWATWCAPCIKELPAIKFVEQKYADKKFKVLLLSFDFRKDLASKV
jgi:thiol-disulfide isomerase/thioredoxin